jgi:NhaC family Na+:H+ antiporter
MQLALIVTRMAPTIVIMKNGHSWNEIVKAGQRALSSASLISILLFVAALIGAWNMSGTIPTMAAIKGSGRV